MLEVGRVKGRMGHIVATQWPAMTCECPYENPRWAQHR